jgi:acyl-CoA thioesterase
MGREMTLDGLWRELQDLNENEIYTIHKLVQALKRTRVSPLAYIEEMMHFQSLGLDQPSGAYIHRMLVTDELRNRLGILHGGVTATFIDTAMGSTVFQDMGIERGAVTLDLNIHFLSPAREGWLTAKSHIIKKGKTIVVLETKVTDEENRLIASASGTFYRLKK